MIANDFTGQVALVTDAAPGKGLATARAFARSGRFGRPRRRRCRTGPGRSS